MPSAPKTPIPSALLHAVFHAVREHASARRGDLGSLPSTLGRILQHLGEESVGSWHPYGFIVVHLGKLSDGSGSLRFHMWPYGDRVMQEPHWPIHSHPWDLVSLVLCGSIRHETYRQRLGAQYRAYSVDYRDDASLLLATDTVCTADLLDAATLRAGSSYLLRAGDLHAAAAPPGSVTATLVATSATSGPPTVVLGDLEASSRLVFTRSQVSRDLLHRTIGAVADAVVGW